MTRRFIVATDPLTSEQVQQLKTRLGGCGWWHWLPNFWLVKDSADAITVTMIRDWIHSINGDARALVMQVEETTWAALVKPGANGKSMSEWLKNTWPD